MRLINRPSMGSGLHRSGWPLALQALQNAANHHGILLDDCPEYSFLFGPSCRPRTEPWIGIFHYPHHVNSPYPYDLEYESAYALLRNAAFQESLPSMRAGIALSESLANWLEYQLGRPFMSVKHPTATDVLQWSMNLFQSGCEKMLFQIGFSLRNTRAICRQPPRPGWRYLRTEMPNQRLQERDRALEMALPSHPGTLVAEHPHMHDADYDLFMAMSVVLTETFGCSACNTIVECIARGTPLLINYSAEAAEYLGEDYPLYIHMKPELDGPILELANLAMIHRRGPWLDYQIFALQVVTWASNFECD